jgi:hypothetical protein
LAAILGASLALSGCTTMDAKKQPDNRDEIQSAMRAMRHSTDHPDPFSFSNTGRSIEKDLGVE